MVTVLRHFNHANMTEMSVAQNAQSRTGKRIRKLRRQIK